VSAQTLRAMQAWSVALAVVGCLLTLWAACSGRITSALIYAVVAQISIAVGFDTARKRERVTNNGQEA
jgi:hypothetical protein